MSNETKSTLFTVVPLEWINNEELTPQDLARLLKLWTRYDYHASQTKGSLVRCMYASQETLCPVLGFSEKSRTKLSAFLVKMENMGYVVRIKTGVVRGSDILPRTYTVVLNPASSRYKRVMHDLWIELSSKRDSDELYLKHFGNKPKHEEV